MASDSHAKRPIVVERRKEKGRKKTPRLTKTYDVKIIPATVGVVAETEEPPKKRVAAYCRVSTDQEAQETSLEEQMAHFNTVIAEHPDWELAGIYADEGISGTQVKHRVQFQQMIEDAKAKLSQGAHEESEHVQTSGLSNPVERTVLNCDKVLASMNREVQTQRTEQFLEPYYEVCEQIELFEVGLRSLRGQTRLVAEQLFVEGKKQTEITGADGNNLTRRTVVREKKNALVGIADTICRYQKR